MNESETVDSLAVWHYEIRPCHFECLTDGDKFARGESPGDRTAIEIDVKLVAALK